jgi:predicted AlkP superfamily pyrophosphatase or phosphodiesterase
MGPGRAADDTHMKRTVVLDVVGLTGALIGAQTPRLAAFTRTWAHIDPVTPAVTCSAQATYLTGVLPSQHGIVGNGWYFRDLNEIWLWRQSNRLIQAPRIWDTARRRDPGFTCASTFWWYAMATTADVTLTPRPIYCADGLKLPDCYTDPPELRDELTRRLGTFPLFQFWGPATSIASSQWIAEAAMAVEERHRPTLQLVYLPHLDYCLQRLGPRGDITQDLRAIDALCGRLFDYFQNRGLRIVVLSEYGIVPVRRPVHPNRILRAAGYLAVKVDLEREYLDPGRSRAFAVSDHQIAHLYVRSPADIDACRALFESTPGGAAVLDTDGKRQHGLAHERAGELVLLAEPDSWFTYYFWSEDARAPDYARMVDIHRKPGYDPCELFVDPRILVPMLRIGITLARKALGFRYTMEVTPLDATLVKGSHGLGGGAIDERPVFATSEPKLLDDSRLAAVDVHDRLLRHVFAD